ncbi:hypothetical protein IMF23_12165 [Chelatococcus daeguensis]|uniref:Uncharacterized protein n=1 Tax=Chelatococcus sambhunathii TaxID=363953 RepID=A0ABM9U055_9HYPH|nr:MULTISPECIES: hypothetical protein [Chelatococcus]KZE36049.1 hypothetical protein AVW15_11485 [Chelatococcus daeguensis]MBM3084194.1 hypothetical protein [Chelatococcus daeguensis]CUA84845.1 hypothetical protein Ga0061061_101568 [Chelatococcus sambhunathii]
MALRFGLFGRKDGDDGARVALAALKERARIVLCLSDEATVAVNEIVCADPACPGLETVVLIMEPGRRTRALKIAKAAGAVTDDDLHTAAAGARL